MAEYEITTESGAKYIITTEDVPKSQAQPKPSGMDLAGGFLKGAIGDTMEGLAQAGRRVLSGPRDPVDAIRSAGLGPLGGVINDMLDAQGEQLIESGRAAKRGDWTTAAGRALYGMIPGGPALEQGIQRVMSGNPEEQARGAGNLAAMVIPGAARRPAGAIRDLAAKAAGPIRESAIAQYERVLAPSGKRAKAVAEKVAPQMLDKSVTATTKKGLQRKVQGELQKATEALDSQWDQIDAAGTNLDAGSILQRISDRALQDHTLEVKPGQRLPLSPDAANALKFSEGLQEVLALAGETDPASGAFVIPASRARSIRQYWDSMAADAGRYAGADLANLSKARAYGLAADEIRAELASSTPSLANINKSYSLWKNASDLIESAVSREVGKAKGLGTKMVEAAATGAGLVKGGIPGAIASRATMSALESVIASPAWNTVSAVLKNKLANALARGNSASVESTLKSIQAATVGGQSQTDKEKAQ